MTAQRPTTGQPLPFPPSAKVIPLRQPGEQGEFPFQGQRTRCLDCQLRDGCLPSAMPDSSLHLLDRIVIGRRRVLAGQPLYLQGDAFRNLYPVHSGSFKSVVMLHGGRDQVLQFSMPGDVLGLEGIASSTHASSAIALEDGDVCVIPFEALHEVAEHSREWQDALCRIMGNEILREHGQMQVLGSASTEGRVAVFLLQVSERMQARGYSPTEFHVRMSRADIGSYLGLTLETVSRTLSGFQRQGLLEVKKRHVRIRDILGLRRIREVGGG